MSDIGYKPPPQALEAEKAVLGCALFDDSACRWVASNLVPEAFYLESHRAIFGAIRDSFKDHGAADLTLVHQRLVHVGQSGEAGGKEYLKEVLGTVASSNFTEHYGKLVLRAYYDRQVLRESDRLKSEDTREDALDRIGRIFRARDLLESRGVVMLADSVARVLRRMDEGPVDLMGTGFAAIDQVLRGSEAGDLVTVGARTGVGKTAYLVCQAMNLAQRNKRVAIFSGEMGPDQVTRRALAARARVEHWRVRAQVFGEGDAARLVRAAESLHQLPISYCGLPSPRLQDIRATCDATRADVAVVDYLTRCTLPQAESMRVSVNMFMKGLKNFARETRRVVYLAAQINRLTDKSPDSPPTLSDLKESGAIEEESDAVLLLHIARENRHRDQPIPLQVMVAKNRHGKTGISEVVFDRRYMEVRDAISGELGGAEENFGGHQESLGV